MRALEELRDEVPVEGALLFAEEDTSAVFSEEAVVVVARGFSVEEAEGSEGGGAEETKEGLARSTNTDLSSSVFLQKHFQELVGAGMVTPLDPSWARRSSRASSSVTSNSQSAEDLTELSKKT